MAERMKVIAFDTIRKFFKKKVQYGSKFNLQIREGLERHFAAFGDIISIRIYDECLSSVDFGFAIVEFSDNRVGEAYILNETDVSPIRVIAGTPNKEHFQTITLNDELDDFFTLPCRQIVSTARKIENVVEVLEEPPDQDSPSNILNALNNDCLQQVFERLPIEDLCSVADTCTKFKTNVQRISSLQFDNFTPTTNTLYCLESLLRNFGNKIKSLSIRHKYISRTQVNSLILTLAIYCRNSNCQIEVLDVPDIKIDPMLYDILWPNLSRLKRLSISLEHDNVLDLMNENEMLEVLKINCPIPSNKIMYRSLSNFPNLRQLELRSHKYQTAMETMTVDEMALCLAKVKYLKKLTLPHFLLDFNDTKDIIDLLADAEVKIEWLFITSSLSYHKHINFDGIARLKSLKILEMDYISTKSSFYVKMIKKLTNLNEFHSKDSILKKDDVKEMAKCEMLKLLNIRGTDFEGRTVFNDHLYDEILRIVLGRESKNKLTIRMQTSGAYFLQVSKDKINANREILDIQ